MNFSESICGNKEIESTINNFNDEESLNISDSNGVNENDIKIINEKITDNNNFDLDNTEINLNNQNNETNYNKDSDKDNIKETINDIENEIKNDNENNLNYHIFFSFKFL